MSTSRSSRRSTTSNDSGDIRPSSLSGKDGSACSSFTCGNVYELSRLWFCQRMQSCGVDLGDVLDESSGTRISGSGRKFCR